MTDARDGQWRPAAAPSMPQSRLSPGLVAAGLARLVARFERSATVSLIDHDEFGVLVVGGGITHSPEGATAKPQKALARQPSLRHAGDTPVKEPEQRSVRSRQNVPPRRRSMQGPWAVRSELQRSGRHDPKQLDRRASRRGEAPAVQRRAAALARGCRRVATTGPRAGSRARGHVGAGTPRCRRARMRSRHVDSESPRPRSSRSQRGSLARPSG